MFALEQCDGDLGSDNMLWLRPAVYGDDHLVSVRGHPNINQQSFCDWFESIGVIYTDENKVRPTRPYTTLEEATFLKRNFVKRGGYVWGPLPKSQLYEMIQWYRHSETQKKKSQQKLSEEVLDCVLNEAFFHGREEYEKMKKDFVEYAYKHHKLRLDNAAKPYNDKWRLFMGSNMPVPLMAIGLEVAH